MPLKFKIDRTETDRNTTEERDVNQAIHIGERPRP